MVNKELTGYSQQQYGIPDPSLNGEEWKVVIYRNVQYIDYEISNFGRFRRRTNGDSSLSWAGKILTLNPDRSGYLKASLYVGTEKKHIKPNIHSLVAEAFIGPVDFKNTGMTVNHKDGDKLNNHVDNLEIISWGDNCRHAWEAGLMNPESRRGVGNGRSKLTADQVLEIRLKYDDPEYDTSHQRLADDYGVHKGTIADIINRKIWKHI